MKTQRIKDRELTQEEIDEAMSVGILVQNWYAVKFESNQMPFALFQEKAYAEAYKEQFCATAILEPWPMAVKNFSK